MLVLDREEDSSWRYDSEEVRQQGWWYVDFVEGKLFVYPSSSSTGVKSMPAIGGHVFPMGMVTVVGYVDG